MTDEELAIPSNRIRFALEAMKEFEAKPDCAIDMDDWRWVSDGICFACCAGAASVKKLNLTPSPTDESWTCVGTVELASFELSLNAAREGFVGDMFDRMGLCKYDGDQFNRRITIYEDSPAQFYADMNKLANDLQAAGY